MCSNLREYVFMQLLIVGCGYLGQRLATRCQQAGHTVQAMTRSAERAEVFRARGWQPIVADICEPATLSHLPEVDAVVFAVGYDRTSGRTQQEVYVQGLAHILERVAGRCHRFIYISSSSVYGQQAGEWVDEDSVCEPTQTGGQCCLSAEQQVEAKLSGSRTQGVVLRLSGIYGPGRLLSRIESLRNGEPLTGSPASWLNLIHVDDAVSMCQKVLQDPPRRAVYLVSDDAPVPRGVYYQRLAELVGAPQPVFDESQPARRGAGGLNKRCSNRRMRDEWQLTLEYPSYREGLAHALGDASKSA